MKKIIFIDHTPFAGGAQYVLSDHISNLDKKRFSPVVICSFDSPTLADLYQRSGAKVYKIKFGRLKTFSPIAISHLWQSVREIARIISLERPDLIVSNTVRAHIIGSVVARKYSLPLIWIIRDYTFPRPLFRLLSFIPSKILTVSKDLLSFYRIDSTPRGLVIYVGTDFDKKLKKINSKKIQELKQDFGITKDCVVVGFAGRLVGWKGSGVLVDSIALMKKDLPTLKCLIVGGGKGQDDNIEEELKRKIRSLGLEDQVVLVGEMGIEEMPCYFKLFDIFVHPSFEPEPFATVVVQAMMTKLAVIGTNLGGTPEIIKNGQNGLLVPPNDSIALAEAIKSLAKDRGTRESLGKEAYDTVYPVLTEESVTKVMEGCYGQTIK